MPTISDTNTVQALARGYLASGKVKEKGLLAAEYKPSYARSAKGMKLYEKPEVIAAIAEIEAEVCKDNDLKIKTRLQRQAWWSAMMDDKDAQRPDRLRASELLGKSEADFITIDITASMDAPQAITPEQIEVYKRMAQAATAEQVGPRLSKEA